MKLNKVMALALSGLMAVSMLAGCAGNPDGGDNGEQPPVVDNTVSGRVIAALDSDTTAKVSFASDDHLNSVLSAVIANSGFDADKVTADKLIAADPDLGGVAWLTKVNNNEDDAKKEQTYVGIVKMTDSSELGVSLDYAIKQLAAKIDKENVCDSAKHKFADLPAYTTDYTSTSGDKYYYTFEYTGTVAVAEMQDAVTGLTGYVAAYTVTRTPTKVEK